MKRIILILPLLISCNINLYPQWSNDPNVNLYVGTGIKTEACSDSAGGCYVVYESGPSKQLSVRWFDKYGYQPWGWKKIIQGEYPEQWQSKSIDDGEGGVIVSYEDMLDNIPYEYKTRIRVQRINKAGTFLWGQTGVRVSLEEINQSGQKLVSDGSGGVVAVWLNSQAEYTVNRLNSQGQRMWGDSGIVVTIDGNFDKPNLIRASDGKYYLEIRENIYRISQNGNVALWDSSAEFGLIVATPDDGGGILHHMEWHYPTFDIFAQRKDTLGNNLWQDPYVSVCDSNWYNSRVQIQYNSGYFFYAWTGNKNGADRVPQFQALRLDGSKLFPSGSIKTGEPPLGTPLLFPPEPNRLIVIWDDAFTLPDTTLAQCYDTLGNKIWNENGVVLAYPALGYKSFTTDGNGGFIIAGNKNEFTIIVQQVSKYGNLGEVIIPVELTSFYANVKENKVELYWQTATETNNQGFEILRLAQNDNSSWERIGFIEGSGTTTEPKSYSFSDDNLNNGNYKYKLKQIDFDGTFEYSKEIEVEVNLNPTEFVLYQNYPNPFNPNTTIRFEIPGQARNDNVLVTLKVYDVLGNEVAIMVNEERHPSAYEVEFNGSQLSSGIYFYTLSSGNYSSTKKLILLK
jgi:hypothetical protein